ncbi:hypothetical protein BGX26_001640 [Mortierella sp. AD094]|nr:hypothetical protein BGX26_001640 [Mortierella sp. AD094]
MLVTALLLAASAATSAFKQHPFNNFQPDVEKSRTDLPSDHPIERKLQSLKHRKSLQSLVDKVNIDRLRKDIIWLTGEDEESPIQSRFSVHPDVRLAADWIAEQIESTGANCEQRGFLPGFSPNIICRYPSAIEMDEIVILGAHYDCRGGFGKIRAPGADGNGSGTGAVIEVARVIGSMGVTVNRNLELALFSGEEQGLLGSRAYARELREAGADIIMMVNADMLAFRVPGKPIQIAFPDLIGSPELSKLLIKVTEIYVPNAVVGYTSACCSDHQSFHDQGFPASSFFERVGPIADPMFRNSGDLVDREGYDFEQLGSATKAILASVFEVVEFIL